MRFRQLKETSKVSVGVYRSHIHGRGLFCKRDIEEGIVKQLAVATLFLFRIHLKKSTL